MKQGLSKPPKIKTPEQVLEEFHRSGKSIMSWADANGFHPPLVYEVLKGKRKCLRGQSHSIAVRLGIKDGVVED